MTMTTAPAASTSCDTMTNDDTDDADDENREKRNIVGGIPAVNRVKEAMGDDEDGRTEDDDE